MLCKIQGILWSRYSIRQVFVFMSLTHVVFQIEELYLIYSSICKTIKQCSSIQIITQDRIVQTDVNSEHKIKICLSFFFFCLGDNNKKLTLLDISVLRNLTLLDLGLLVRPQIKTNQKICWLFKQRNFKLRIFFICCRGCSQNQLTL